MPPVHHAVWWCSLGGQVVILIGFFMSKKSNTIVQKTYIFKVSSVKITLFTKSCGLVLEDRSHPETITIEILVKFYPY